MFDKEYIDNLMKKYIEIDEILSKGFALKCELCTEDLIVCNDPNSNVIYSCTCGNVIEL